MTARLKAVRLDTALAASGKARSRTHAARLIAEGQVTVDGQTVTKASTRVDSGAVLDVPTPDHYVSRAAHKLIAALDAFAVPVRGRLALDLGASTGGFTQVLRERGARTVIALDVGHGQLATEVAADPGVISVQGVNVRFLSIESLAEHSGSADRPELIVADLSFISLRYVLPALAAVAADEAEAIVLVKPQFEVGRTAVKDGLVTDPAAHATVLRAVLRDAQHAGLGFRGVIASPLQGMHGNREFLVHLAPGRGNHPSDWGSVIDQVAGVA